MARQWHRTILTASALLPIAAASVLAGPNGPQVMGGAATVQGQGTANVVVNQSTQSAIINWQTFNIGAGETTKIYMPNSNSTQLDRVIGGSPTQILGTLYSNGKVFLVNPDGILFGMGARINVGSLVATTNDITNSDFMAGSYNFSIPGNPNASIVNMGTITAQTGGFAALVAPGVRNTGTIIARLGTIALASGNQFTLDMYGDNLITLGLTDSISSQVVDVATGKPLKSLVSNKGELKANGGTVVLTAVAARKIVDSVINNSGVIEANTIGSHKGMIVLGAAGGVPNQKVKVSGRLSAAGKRAGTSGGTIQITGDNVKVAHATIDASGLAGGGTVLIGGDWGGGNPNTGLVSGNASAALQPYAVPNANTVSIDAATTIDASATETGNGGKVIVWANQATTFLGTIMAKGGAQSGNGGFVETSGGTLSFNSAVNTSALNGKTGTWLLDPNDLTVDQSDAREIVTALSHNNVVLETGASGYGDKSYGQGDINIDASISWNGSHTLTLDAYHDIVINNAISAANGGLMLNANNSIFTNADVSVRTFTLSATNSIFATADVTVGTFTLQDGDWQQVGSLPAFSANNFVLSGGSFLRARGGNGSSGSPYQLIDVYGLEGIGSSSTLLSRDYILANNVDASGTANWNGGTGFVSIGDSRNAFNGSLNGAGFTINNLTINSSATDVGLFGVIGHPGSVQNLGITNISLIAQGSGNSEEWNDAQGYSHIGALAGNNLGAISDSYATGIITSASRYGTAPDTGGLVGTNSGSISKSYAAVNIAERSTGDSLYLGGLVGWNDGGTVTQSYAAGTVRNNSTGSAEVGGLIGYNTGSVSQSYSIGAVSGRGNLGGLIGSGERNVSSSYWDTQTSGQRESDGGSPLTTAQFQAGLPGGFDATAWGSYAPAINNGLPYLLWQLPTNSQVVAGYVFNDAGITSAGSGISVSGLVNGVSLGTVTTGTNGSYNIVLLPGTISASGSQVLTYTTGDHAGAAYIQNATGSVENLNIYIGYLNETSNAANLSSVSNGLSIAIGGHESVGSRVASLRNRTINAIGTSFAIDQSLSAETLLLSNTGTVTQSAPITATNLGLSGNGGSFTLTNSSNQIGTLAATVGSVSLTDATKLTIGTVGGSSGVTASNSLTLDVNGNIAALGAINVGTFTLVNGNWVQDSPSLPSFSAENFVISGGSFLRAAGGDGSSGNPYQVADIYGLQGIGSSATLLADNYVVANNIDANGTANWNGGAGFVAIGGKTTSFTGTLNGNGNTISGLTINASATNIAGLFGFVGSGGTVENVGLTGGSVSGGFVVGELVGFNSGTVINSYAIGAIDTSSALTAGGLIGTNEGVVSGSYASVVVSGGDFATVGGLVGANFGTISQSHATGNVTAGMAGIAGGLVGTNLNTLDSNGHVVVASITGSYATGNVSVGSGLLNFTTSTAGGLVGDNFGSVSQSSANGAVSVGANGVAGGLVGQNGLGTGFGQIGTASISNSSATGGVSSSGINVQLGGLVGQNDPGAQITNSQASGNVASTASLPPQDTSNNCLNCEYVNVGGFVGANYGTITGTAWTSSPANCTAASTCATGNVSVGALGSGGGFAGYNEGIIQYAFATGKVTGAAGLPDTIAGDVFDNTTQIAGFVADNHGQIAHAFATGNVGTAGAMWLSAGGFAGTNKGTIDSSFATGAVSTGDNSTAGGFTVSNGLDTNPQTCPSCFVGDGYNNSAAISNSQASGNVTVGALSLAGGFAAIGGDSNGQTGGSFTNISASGAVNGGHDSIVGGLVGVLGESGTIANSSANNTLVASAGANSIVGGVAGVNEGTISDTSSTAPVSGTSDSYIGGIAGINLGLVTGSSTDPAISGSGGNNFIGGIAGLNVGSIDNSTDQVALASGSPNYAGGVAGVNAAYSGTQATIPNSSFPIGTITNSSSSGSGFTNQVGTTSPSFIPGLPSWLAGCTDAACTVLTGGSVQPGTTPSNPPPSNPPPSNPPPNNPPPSNPPPSNSTPSDSTPSQTVTVQQVPQFTQSNFTPTNIAPPLVDPTTLASLNAGTPGNVGNGANGNTGSLGNGNTGSLANGRQGGNGAPPGIRLIDMHVMPLPPGTGLPPPGETRFLANQLVLQFGAGLTSQQIAAIAQRFGLTIVAQQSIGALGRTVYTFQINNGQSVTDLILAINKAGLNAAPQPNYTYGLTQDQRRSAADLGDPAQYIVPKLQLGAVHRITQGKDVVVALIDSQVDTKQPDIADRIVDSYDAGCGPNTPPDAHGTGMAGAIASHIGLLGVAPNAEIIAICAFGGTGTPEATSVKIIRGLDYAIAHGAKIINMSFAGPYDPALAQELQIAREKGILIIAAAGNAGPKSPPLYPGADPNVMAVTATDEHDGLFKGANQGSYVAVAAPGVNILVPAPNGDIQFTTGTSVASANVSGVAALLMAEKQAHTPEEIRAILVSTARHLGPKGINPQFGAGLVDPLKALRHVPATLGRKPTANTAPLQLH
ncbi:MAG TPA: S8 family serine peptidase [Xanthobacteraceae bacterium]